MTSSTPPHAAVWLELFAPTDRQAGQETATDTLESEWARIVAALLNRPQKRTGRPQGIGPPNSTPDS